MRMLPPTVIHDLCLALAWVAAPKLAAHCETLDGPVALDARSTLQKGDMRPVLKRFEEDCENEVRQVFDEALKARTGSKSPQVREPTGTVLMERIIMRRCPT